MRACPLLYGVLAFTIGGLTSCIGIGITLGWYWNPELALWRLPLWQSGMLAFFLAWIAVFRFEIHSEIRDDILTRYTPASEFFLLDCKPQDVDEENDVPS